MSDSSPQIGPKRALIRSPVTNRDFMPRLSWRGSLFVRSEGELGELSHPPPACPGGTPRAMNERPKIYKPSKSRGELTRPGSRAARSKRDGTVRFAARRVLAGVVPQRGKWCSAGVPPPSKHPGNNKEKSNPISPACLLALLLVLVVFFAQLVGAPHQQFGHLPTDAVSRVRQLHSELVDPRRERRGSALPPLSHSSARA